MKAPAQIVHTNYTKRDNFANLVAKVVKVCHMDRGETALLLYYASCSSGFQPAAKLIAEKIGVSAAYVTLLRNMLATKGILNCVNNQIVIDWNRIRTLSALDPAKTSKDGWVKPQSFVGIDRMGKIIAKYPTLMEMYTGDLNLLIEKLGRMPEYVFQAWRAQLNRELKTFPMSAINSLI